MRTTLNGFPLCIEVYERDTLDPVAVSFSTKQVEEGILSYQVSVNSPEPVSARVEITLKGEEDAFHLIPCNIHGDNNLFHGRPGDFPNLTRRFPGSLSCSGEWEFRADRASHPVSALICKSGVVAISIDPYSTSAEHPEGFLRNGVFSRLDRTAGVSLGYRNLPYTFVNKEDFRPSTGHSAKRMSAMGFILAFPGDGRREIRRIFRFLYHLHREIPVPRQDVRIYLEGFLNAFEHINWSRELDSFTNLSCRVPLDPVLKPWRPLLEIGWTGTGVLVYPLLAAQIILGIRNGFSNILSKCLDAMADRYNPASGFFYDLIRDRNQSPVNGWWAGYMVKDCHCAYTNGSGVYYLLRSYLLLRDRIGVTQTSWREQALRVLNTVISLQKPDGNFGYTYSVSEPRILDDHGFAGIWFAAALALAYVITGLPEYLDSARKGMRFYHAFVRDLSCWGTPMDTWKSVDQEGNLGFLRAARLLHEETGEREFLDMLEDGAHYEYLWRYCFRARPEHPPLKDSDWNSVGGSVTSVSNPHIHPMGVYATPDLLYLFRMTGDPYHRARAYDGLHWGLATADLYPGVTGYGSLGTMTERYCPSDGLIIEHFAHDESPSSIWFTFNGWASASVLEGLAQTILEGHSWMENTI